MPSTGSSVSACCRAEMETELEFPVALCSECGAEWVEWDGEPSDDELANRYGMEGGISYDPLREQLEEARRLK